MAIITISRELGASGTYIALKLAEKLGYTCYDQQIINTIAEKMGKEKDQLQAFDQNTYNRISVFFQEALASLSQGGMIFHPFGLGAINWDANEMFSSYPQQSFKEKDYYEVLRQVFKEVAAKDNVVFLGRGGCHILRNHEKSLHVRIIADYEDRLNHVIKEEMEGGRLFDKANEYKVGEDPDLDRQRAEKLIHDWDTASANFISDFFDSDWNDSHNYDMVLNTSKFTPDYCVSIIENAVTGL